MKSVLNLLLFFCFALAFQSSFAYSILQPIGPNFDESFKSANLIFEGELMDVQSNWVSGGYKLVFKVKQSWKRSTEEYTTVNLPKSENCLERFEQGENYLIYAEKKYNLKVSCKSRCYPWDSENLWEDRMELGAGLSPSQSPGTEYLPYIMTLLILGGMGLVAVVVLRKGNKAAIKNDTGGQY